MSSADTTVSRWIRKNPDAIESHNLLAEGEVVAGYTVRRKIGKGLSGEVYEIWHPVLNTAFALKIFNLKSQTDVARLISEVRSLAQIHHPNVIAIHQFGEHNGHPFFIMDFAESLPDRLSLGETKQLVAEIASALSALHKAGVVHRDVKPQNILRRDGHYLLADFSIVHLADSSASVLPLGMENPTIQEGVRAVIGTHGYIAPEILEGHEATAFSDQFSLAATVLALNPEIIQDKCLEGIIQRAIGAKPEFRYKSVRDFAAAFQPRAFTRRPLLIFGIGMVILASLALIGITLFHNTTSKNADSFQNYDPVVDSFTASRQAQLQSKLAQYEKELADEKAKIEKKRTEILGPYKGIKLFEIKDPDERMRTGDKIADAQMRFARETFDWLEQQRILSEKIKLLREQLATFD